MTQTFCCRRTLLVALLLAITVCAGQQPQQKQPEQNSERSASTAHLPGQKRQVKGVGNFGQVTPTLFRGAQPSQEGFDALAKMGIDIVVDTRGDRADSEGKEVGRNGMQYVAIPWHCPFPDDEVFVRFLKLIEENPGKKVFVHCRLGEDRTGMMVAAYRMAAQGWTADEAMLEMRAFGFSGVHYLICPGLASYEKKFPEHLEKNPALGSLHSSPHAAAR